MNKKYALDEAKKRLEAGRKERDKRRQQTSTVDEPKHLKSGDFDEVELKRIELSEKVIEKALQESEKKLEDKLENIENRHNENLASDVAEPKGLKSGSRDDLEKRRLAKEQKDEKLP